MSKLEPNKKNSLIKAIENTKRRHILGLKNKIIELKYSVIVLNSRIKRREKKNQ